MKTAESYLTHGTGNFINCTDYDTAVEVIKQAQSDAITATVKRCMEIMKSPPFESEPKFVYRDRILQMEKEMKEEIK